MSLRDTYRHRQPWTVREVLDLQREYELLDISIIDIATKHAREVDAITYKISNEGFVRRMSSQDTPAIIPTSKDGIVRRTSTKATSSIVPISKRVTRSMTSSKAGLKK
jgi:hypothetical protein